MLTQIDDSYIRTLLSKGDRDRAAYTAVAPTDKRDLTLQFATTPVTVLTRFGSGMHLGFDPGLGILMLGWEMLLLI
jgi:hypothetical protein